MVRKHILLCLKEKQLYFQVTLSNCSPPYKSVQYFSLSVLLCKI